jgi:glycosyltransferase involved in cell wall biosynthesis
VVTVFDVCPEVEPHRYCVSPLSMYSAEHLLSIERASRIIALSQFTARRLERDLGVSADRISIIYAAPGPEYRSDYSMRELALEKAHRHLPSSFLFYAAYKHPHKNHVRLFEALSILNQCRGERLKLVITGRPQRQRNELDDAISRLGLSEDVLDLGYVPNEEMPLLYRLASLLVFPSLMEGFGLPVLEAMASGCPVVCSNVTSLPEVAGDAALFCNPRDPEDIAQKIALVLDDEGLRSRLIKNGFARASQFSWEKAALQTIKVYQSVIGARP